MNKLLTIKDLGLRDYKETWDYQEVLFQKILQIKSKNSKENLQLETPNYFLYVEHPHVYTLGKSGHIENLLISEEKLKALQDIQMDPNTAKDPETVKAMIQRKKELMQKDEGMGDKIADMAQSMSKDEFMSKADELGLSQEEAAEHYEKMQGGAHAGKFEGNMFAQAVQKAKAAGMKAGDKFKVGDKEYTLQDAIELAGMQLEDFFSEEETAYDNQIDRIKNLAFYQ